VSCYHVTSSPFFDGFVLDGGATNCGRDAACLNFGGQTGVYNSNVSLQCGEMCGGPVAVKWCFRTDSFGTPTIGSPVLTSPYLTKPSLHPLQPLLLSKEQIQNLQTFRQPCPSGPPTLAETFRRARAQPRQSAHRTMRAVRYAKLASHRVRLLQLIAARSGNLPRGSLTSSLLKQAV
jgi:hypothetical protein